MNAQLIQTRNLSFMNAHLIASSIEIRHTFRVTHEEKTYDAVIWLNPDGKFCDDELTLNGNELGFEGPEGDVREAITEYLAENWDSLVKK